MSNQLQIIEQKLTSDEVTNRIALALNIPPDDEAAQNKAKKYASSVLAEVTRTKGSKNDLTLCNPDSIVQTMIDAAQFQVAIDGRQQAHLIAYGKNCSFQMGYRGYLAKIKEHYPDADFVTEPVYEGDEVKLWNENGVQKYTHNKKAAFRSGENGFIGVLFAVTYTDNGRLICRVMDVPKERIDRARAAAKQKYVWSSDYIEKAKAAAIKVACKQLFASIQGLQDIASYDNKNNFKLQDATPVRKSLIDNINESLGDDVSDDQPEEKAEKPAPKEEPHEAQGSESVTDADFEEVEVSDVDPQLKDNLIKMGDKAASGGLPDYRAWVGGLSDGDKDIVRYKHAGWQSTAKEVSAQILEEQKQQKDSQPSGRDNDAPLM